MERIWIFDLVAQLFALSTIVKTLTALNLLTFAAFGIDKLRARSNRRRIPEAALLWLALLGGTPGAYAGRALFCHKTRKQPFSGRLHAVAAVQVVALGVGLAWMVGGPAFAG